MTRSFCVLAPQNVCQFKHKITWNPQEMVVTYLVFACKSSYEDLCMMPKSFVKLRGNISTYEGDMNNGAAHAIAACYEDGCSILKLTRECATENFLILMVRILIFIAVLLVSLKLSL